MTIYARITTLQYIAINAIAISRDAHLISPDILMLVLITHLIWSVGKKKDNLLYWVKKDSAMWWNIWNLLMMHFYAKLVYTEQQNIVEEKTNWSSNVVKSRRNGRVLNEGLVCTNLRSWIFLLLFTQVFGNDFSSFVRINSSSFVLCLIKYVFLYNWSEIYSL